MSRAIHDEPGGVVESHEINNTARPSCYVFGLDLGQLQDYSALAVLEPQSSGKNATHHCRYLKRWPLRTPYPVIVADMEKMIHAAEIQNAENGPHLAIDATGVGAPVVDLFKQARLKARLRPIQITGGDQVTQERGMTRVPKRDLVSVAQVALQTGRLKIAPELAEAATLTRELMNFQVKISLDTAHDTYGAWREGAHDDLVLAVALALWVGEGRREWVCV